MNKEQKAEYMRQYAIEHRKENRARVKKHYWKNIERNREYNRMKRLAVKNRLFLTLGDVCVKCGNDDLRVLQFDHINGGGIKDSLRFKKNNDTMIRYYSNNPKEAKEKLQVLCANCNWIKRAENGEY